MTLIIFVYWSTADVVLSQKLTEELQYEKTAAVDVAEPEFLKSFKEQGIWEIEDVSGNDEVTLIRKFGNETIRLIFSIADIQSQEESEFAEEEESEESSPEEDHIHSYGIRVAFSITKVCILNLKSCIVQLTFCFLSYLVKWSWCY